MNRVGSCDHQNQRQEVKFIVEFYSLVSKLRAPLACSFHLSRYFKQILRNTLLDLVLHLEIVRRILHRLF